MDEDEERRRKRREERELQRKLAEEEEERKAQERRILRAEKRKSLSLERTLLAQSLNTQEQEEAEKRKKEREEKLTKIKSEAEETTPKEENTKVKRSLSFIREKEVISNGASVFVFYSGLYIEGDQMLLHIVDIDATIEKIIKSLLRKASIKGNTDEYILCSFVNSIPNELSPDKTLNSYHIKAKDILILKPKTSVRFVLKEGIESLNLDLKAPIMNTMPLVGALLGWDSMEDYVLFPSKEAHECFDYKKSLSDQGVSDGGTVYLLENKTQAAELKKKLTKKSLFSKRPSSMLDSELNSSPTSLIKLIRTTPTTWGVVSLSCALSSSSSFYLAFLHENGLANLFEFLSIKETKIQFLDKDDNYFLYLNKVVHCIQIALNKESGLKESLTIPHALRKLITQLDPDLNSPKDFSKRKKVLDILAAVCLFPEGYHLVLDAFDFYKKLKGEAKRFQHLVESMSFSDSPLIYKLSCITLINVLINSPENIELRVKIRLEFNELQLSQIIKDLSQLGDESLDFQIQLFESDRQFDQEEVKFLTDTTFKGVNFNDIDDVFEKLKQNTSSKQSLLTLLQRILTFQDEPAERCLSIWNYIDNLIATVLKVNPNEKIEDVFITHEELREIRRDYDRQIDALQEKLQTISKSNHDQVVDNLLKEQQEKSQKMESTLRTRIQDLEEELVSLRSRLLESDVLVNKLKQSNQTLESQLNDFKIQVQTLSSQSTSTDSTSTFSQDGTPPPPPPPPPGSMEDSFPPPPLPDGGPPLPPSLPDGGPPPPPLPPGFLPPPGGPPLPPGMPGSSASQNIPGLPPKPVINPKKKLKHLNWKKIPNNKILATIWSEAKDEIQLNTEELEELFATKPSASTSRDTKKVEDQVKLVNLLDAKRSNHVGISLGKLKMEFADLKKSIINLDDSVLSLEELLSLKSFIPTPEEINLLNEYKGDIKLLDKPEQFFLEVKSIPHLSQRVENWYFMRTFEESILKLLPDIKVLRNTIKQTTSSKKLIKLLEIILAIGNYLNGGTSNGRAYGFKVDVLLKLVDTKTSNNSSLLNYLVSFVQQKFPDIMDFTSDFPDLNKATKIPGQTLREDIGILRKGIKSVFEELEFLRSNEIVEPENIAYLQRMEKFADQAKKKLNIIDGDMKELEESFKDLALKFGEDPDSFNWEEFLALLLKFCESFEAAKNDIEKLKSEEDKKKKEKEKKKSRTMNLEKNIERGVENVLQEATDPSKIKERNNLRRAKSIRKVSDRTDSKRNLNSLLTMIDQMK